ncbi:hypothetical protein MK489_08660 [Myxococcota bacterium]|nr:hypothetical protein [Myxococcota bacterium]
MQFLNSEISRIVKFINQRTGRKYLYSEPFRGRITITGDDTVTRAEAIELFQTSLALLGFAALPGPGDVYRIVNVSRGVFKGAWTEDELSDAGNLVTTLIKLRHRQVEEILPALDDLVGVQTIAIESPSSNGIILAGPENRLRRLMSIISTLDQKNSEELTIRRLRYASASRAKEMLESFYGSQNQGQERSAMPFQIWLDERTNGLLLMGREGPLTDVKRFIDTIDVPGDFTGSFHVIAVRNTDADSLARIINDLAQDAPSSRESNTAAELTERSPLAGRQFSLVVDAPTRSLVMTADRDTARLVQELVAELDVHTPRVAIDVLATEVNHPSSFELGFAALIPFATQQNELSGGAFSVNPRGIDWTDPKGIDAPFIGRFARSPLSVPLLDGSGNPLIGPDGNPVSISLERENILTIAGEREVRTNVLLRPQLIMSSGEEREFFVGNNLPIPVQSTTEGSFSPLETRQSIERQDIGTSLRIQPTVNATGRVTLALNIERSDLIGSIAGSVEEVGPTIQERVISTNVTLRDGETALLAAYSQPRSQSLETGIPFLRSLPFFGWLFSDIQEAWSEQQLIIAIQIRVLNTSDQMLAETIRRRLAFQRSIQRVEDLNTDALYAVLVTTRGSKTEAADIADELSRRGYEVELSEWLDAEQPRIDVYLTGYGRLSDANLAALETRRYGYTPEVVALPPR